MSGNFGKSKGLGSLFLGPTLALVMLMLLLCLFSLLLREGRLGEGGAKPASLLCVFLSSLLGCVSEAKLCGGKKLTAMIPAAALLVMLMVGRLLSEKAASDHAFTWLTVLAACLPGGIVCLRGSKGKRRDRRR